MTARRKWGSPFDAFYEPEPNTGCWLWIGTIRGNSGYGLYRHKSAHRTSWEMYRGPIPDGLWVLHHCDVRECVNPDHLFLGTQSDNMLDCSRKGYNVLGRRTHCKYGHEFTPENTRIRPGNHGRECISCANAKLARLRAERPPGSVAVSNRNPLRTHCKRGHPLTPENVVRWGGRRLCRTCNTARAIAHQRRRELGRRATA